MAEATATDLKEASAKPIGHVQLTVSSVKNVDAKGLDLDSPLCCAWQKCR